MYTVTITTTTLYESLYLLILGGSAFPRISARPLTVLRPGSVWFAIVAGMMNFACNCIVASLHERAATPFLIIPFLYSHSTPRNALFYNSSMHREDVDELLQWWM